MTRTFKTAESPYRADNTASGKAGVTLMNNQVGVVVAEVMDRQDNVTVTHLPSMIRVDCVGRMDFVYDDISEALGEEPGFYDSAEFEENMSTHYGKMIHMDDRTVMFGNLEEAAEFIGDMLPPEVYQVAVPGPGVRAIRRGPPARSLHPLNRTRARSRHRCHQEGRRGQGTEVRTGSPRPAQVRRRPTRRSRQVHPRAQGPQRHPRKDHRLPGGHQRRRDDRAGDLPARPVREHGRADPQGSRGQDERHRRRRHHDGDGHRAGHRPRGHEGDHVRRQPGAGQAGHRPRRGRDRQAPVVGRAPGGLPGAALSGRRDLGQRRRVDRQHRRADPAHRRRRRRHLRRRRAGARPAGQLRRGLRVRQRLRLAVPRHRPRQHARGPRRPVPAVHGREDHRRPLADAGARTHHARPEAAGHRGREGRGHRAADAGAQPRQRAPQGHRDPGARVRREARAPAGGHGRAVRRQGALEGVVVRVRADRPRAPRAGLAGAGDQREHRDHRGRRGTAAPSSSGCRSCARRWRGRRSAPTRTG